MYFKRLEMVGFKSFMNKTRLKFEPGVTAVVGPNGCGKSNIVDAIKWVLGEQSSKSMRSSTMQDVIFGGTEKHDPVNFAEVSLTLSNEDRILPLDYDEVTITRRLYHTGESEYILNKTPVRLMDVRNLIMGTGIGTSSYSIVEQGRMDLILSSKPEDRRYVFEEASGITRYKTQKREALVKLEKTRDNLLRINDIIREVERQINSIERKARKAERYKARFDELKDLEVKISMKKYRQLGTDDESVMEQYARLRGAIDGISRDVERLSDELVSSRTELNTVTEKLNETQNEMMRISTEIDKNAHTIEVNGERMEEFRKQVERLDWEIEEATERKDVMQKRLGELEERFATVSGKRKDKEEAFNAAEDNLKALSGILENCSLEVKVNREKIVDIAASQTRARNNLIRVEADINNSGSRVKRLESEYTAVKEENIRLLDKMKFFDDQMGESGREMESKKDEYSIFSVEYSSKQRDLSVLLSEKTGKERILNELRPRREFLEKLIYDREGIRESVKDIMARSESGDPLFAGIVGILSEMISISDAYEESLRALIGEAAYAIVVENYDTVEKVTKYLSENSMESVSFIVLDDIRVLMGSKGEDPVDGTLKPMSEIMSSAVDGADAVINFFRDILITESPMEARTFLKSLNDRDVRIVGQKGEIYQKGFVRSRNCSLKESVPLFGRKEKAAEMAAREKEISNEISLIEEAISENENWLGGAVSVKERLEREIRDLQARFSEVMSKRSSLLERLDSISQEISILEGEISEEKQNIENINIERSKLEKEIMDIDTTHNALQVSIDSAQQSIRENSLRREETLFCVSDLKAELSALRKDEENLEDNLTREKAAFERIDSEVEEKRLRIGQIGERIKLMEEETDELRKGNETNNSVLSKLNEEVEEKKDKKTVVAVAVESLSEKLTTSETELETLRDKARDVDIMKKEIEYKKAAILEKVLDTYKVDLSKIDLEIAPDTDWDMIARSIEELRTQLEKMGDVSLGAVEEHKQLEQRFAFLSGQRDDLENSREELLNAIQKINRTTRKKFMDSFEAIRKEFNDYFRMLFNGGKADLVLEDERDVLESGIDIIVRPPGKKLHNIMQLSGGEKAMTAIALIFAIFKVNPSPFCVLDEIDAPLDEANIVRFCRVLQEFLKLSQFVIVTHNRMTIQLADVLYGVTMQEKGVSKLVSVKFGEEKEPERDLVAEAVA